jgi:hypothetical protein
MKMKERLDNTHGPINDESCRASFPALSASSSVPEISFHCKYQVLDNITAFKRIVLRTSERIISVESEVCSARIT